MVYCTYSDVRLLTNLTTSDISDANITSIIAEATSQLNSDFNIEVIREPVYPIDDTRENKIDGSNTIYYTRNWFGKFLADRNNDGNVTTADVTVYQVDNNGNETTLTISSIDDDDCKITLSSAPTSGVDLYITYSYSYIRQLSGSVDNRVKLACVLLSAAYCYAKVNWGRPLSSQFGSTKLERHMDSFNLYYQRYLELVKQIHQIGGIIQNGENIWTF